MKTFAFYLSLVAVFLSSVLQGCGVEKDIETENQSVSTRENTLDGVEYWAYQIQSQNEDGNIEKLAASSYDMVVIDQTRSLVGEEGYDSAADVERLKQSPGTNLENKLVICYMDVGQAESYRWYWRDDWQVGDPGWITGEDPDGWNENYPVRFWEPEWREIIESYIDRIIADGYDGIYLDWLEVYDYEKVVEAAEDEGLDPEKELVKFVGGIAEYARSKKPEFILIAQNAAEMVEVDGYAGMFDGLAQEAVWYDGEGDPDEGGRPGDVRQDNEMSEEYLGYLQAWLDYGKPVFDVEYAGDAQKTDTAYDLGKSNGLRTYVTLRLLDALTENPPPGYIETH